MAELGLFPLGMVLLPTEHVPLHIFEPRYRELVGECLEHEAPFGLVLADDDDSPRTVGTEAWVIAAERLEDGRFDIVVEGRDRFRIAELTNERSFRTAHVEEVVDELDPASPADVERALSLFARLASLAGADVEQPDAGDPQLSFTLAARFELAPTVKQALLESRSERARLQRVVELLEDAANGLERLQAVAANAQTNGKGPHA